MISIVVPVYNVEKYLEKCLSSIVSQSFEDYELLLVDDGSPDRSGAIIDEWAKKDKRIRVIHKQNGGISDARNAGIEQAKGDYLCFIDSDDWIAPDMIETLYDLAIKSGADLVCCNFMQVNEQGEQLRKPATVKPGVYTQDEFWTQRFNSEVKIYYDVAWNKLYRRKLFESLRYPVGLIHEDDQVLYDVVSQCNLIALTDKIGYYYVIRDNSIMRTRRSLRNLSAPDAFIHWAEMFVKEGKWSFAEEALLYGVHELLFCEYGKNGKRSKEYKAIKRRVRQLYHNMYGHLSMKRKVSVQLFLFNEPFARSMDRLYSRIRGKKPKKATCR